MAHPGEFPGERVKITPLSAGIRVAPITEETDVHEKCQKKRPSDPAVW
jgi:hypothetical protein